MTTFHTSLTKRLFVTLVIAMLLAGTFNWSYTASAQQPVPFVNIGIEESALPGDVIAVSAYLTDPLGNPVYDAEIHFTYSVEFLNTEDSVEIGTAITDGTGLALLTWEPRSEGDIKISATFEGDDVFAPANAVGALNVLPGEQLYRELPPYRIPGANIWLTTGLITTVWVIFIGSLALVGWANFKTRNEPYEPEQTGGQDA